MAYGHAERNLALVRQLNAETRKLLGSLDQLDTEQSAWLQEVTSPGRQAGGLPGPARTSNGIARAMRIETVINSPVIWPATPASRTRPALSPA